MAKRAQTPTEAPPAFRERLVVVDDFLPVELAEAMRLDIDDHVGRPEAHGPATHQIWNYWFVPELYAYLRTRPEQVIAASSVQAFMQRLADWSAAGLGLAAVSAPSLALYVPGCHEGLHNEAANGRFGYAYCLTRDGRRTVGGELQVQREGEALRALAQQPGAPRAFFDIVAPKFNRLVVFDARTPHALSALAGSMDHHDGHIVLHGLIREAAPYGDGALDAKTLLDAAAEAFMAFTAGAFIDGYHGPVTLRIEVSAAGAASCQVVLDRVTHPDPGDRRWPMLLNDLVARFEAMRLPPADGPSRMLIPVTFGEPLPPA
jgi:hypothetical protein